MAGPLSWFYVALTVAFVAAFAGVLLTLRRRHAPRPLAQPPPPPAEPPADPPAEPPREG